MNSRDRVEEELTGPKFVCTIAYSSTFSFASFFFKFSNLNILLTGLLYIWGWIGETPLQFFRCSASPNEGALNISQNECLSVKLEHKWTFEPIYILHYWSTIHMEWDWHIKTYKRTLGALRLWVGLQALFNQLSVMIVRCRFVFLYQLFTNF